MSETRADYRVGISVSGLPAGSTATATVSLPDGREVATGSVFPQSLSANLGSSREFTVRLNPGTLPPFLGWEGEQPVLEQTSNATISASFRFTDHTPETSATVRGTFQRS